MKIGEIQIRGLFGYFDHKVPFRTEDRITIIHGANGVGKTTILRLLNDLFAQRFYAIRSVTFSILRIAFTSGAVLTVERRPKEKENGQYELKIELRESTGKPYECVVSAIDRELLRQYPVHMISSYINSVVQVGPAEWRDQYSGMLMGVEEVLGRYADQLPRQIRRLDYKIPEAIKRVLADTEVYLIETQRLSTKRTGEIRGRVQGPEVRERMTVEEYAEHFAGQIKERIKESGSLSASLDRMFPHRLLGSTLPEEATEMKIRELYAEQAKYRGRLMQAGLMKPENQLPLPEEELDEMERKVLWMYLEDVSKKLSLFDQVLQKAEVLLDVINSRFTYKGFSVDENEGFVFKSNHDKSQIPLRALSSGEQHELVLAYELLFRVPKGALVLVDEPELSLHVVWQRKFLEDIVRIAKLADLDFLIATHSPSIIHDRQDLMIGLDE